MLKGSYTVEAALVISLSLMIIGASICLAYDIFVESVTKVSQETEEFDAVALFRRIGAAKEILDEIEKLNGN